jgi:phage repressor protein C with HTH and peptisase S24 domain
MKERLIKFLSYLGIGQAKFAKNVGLSKGYVNNVKDNITIESIKKILSVYPELNENWLLTGDGKMLKTQQPVKQISTHQSIGVPYYDVDFVAGFDLIFNDQTYLPTHNIVFEPFAGAQVWCNVTGNSMSDKINHGDIIALKEIRVEDVLFGEVYAVVVGDIRTIKILRKSTDKKMFRFIPFNTEEYDEQEFEISKIIKIYAVLGSIRKFF